MLQEPIARFLTGIISIWKSILQKKHERKNERQDINLSLHLFVQNFFVLFIPILFTFPIQELISISILSPLPVSISLYDLIFFKRNICGIKNKVALSRFFKSLFPFGVILLFILESDTEQSFFHSVLVSNLYLPNK